MNTQNLTFLQAKTYLLNQKSKQFHPKYAVQHHLSFQFYLYTFLPWISQIWHTLHNYESASIITSTRDHTQPRVPNVLHNPSDWVHIEKMKELPSESLPHTYWPQLLLLVMQYNFHALAPHQNSHYLSKCPQIADNSQAFLK